MDERQNIVNNLTIAQEDLHKDAYGADYPDTDDDMPDAFEGLLEDLPLEDSNAILKLTA